MRTTLDAAGLAVLGYLTVISLDGLPLLLALAGEAVALAGSARRQEDEVAAWGALGALAVGLWFAFVLVPPAALTAGLDDPLAALAGMGALAAAFALVGRLVDVEHAQLGRATDMMAVALVAYLTVAELDGVLLVGALVAEGLLLAAWCRWKDDAGAGNLSVALLGLGLAFAVVIAPPGAFATGLDHPVQALCALGAVALGLLVAGRLIDPERSDLGLLIDAAAVTVVGYLTYLELDGTALVGAVAGEATLLALWARGRRDEFAAWAAIAMVTIGAATAVLLVPPTALWAGLPDPLGAGGALVAVMVAAGAIAWLAPPEDTRPWLVGAIGLAALYLASVLVVTPFQPDGAAADAAVFELPVRQQGQVLLSGLWALVGLCGLVVGLTRDLRPLRLAALGLLLVAVAKVFTFDLASLDSIYRVASFVALGVLLLVAAFVWQRIRPREVPDMREAPAGIR